MSAIYHKEPPTSGKVLLKTTYGAVEVELWPKEAPLACRNFVKHCLDGYFDSCCFFRVIPGFMVQTGDPEKNTGQGGASIWGKDFKDEFHSRLCWNHRGLVGMANSKVPNSNRSQFFFSLGACEWLNRKNTIFGKVTGDTIFNLMRLGEVALEEGTEKPIDECQILHTEVLINPFDDIVPRSKEKVEQSSNESDNESRKGKKGKVVKDIKLLSFEDDDGQEEDVSSALKNTKKEKKEKDLHKAQAQALVYAEQGDRPAEAVVALKKQGSPTQQSPSATSSSHASVASSRSSGTSDNREGSALDSFRKEYLQSRGAVGAATGGQSGAADGQVRQKATLDRLFAFSSSLKQAKSKRGLEEPGVEGGDGGGGDGYHGQVLEEDSGDDDDDDLQRGGGWFAGKLKFRKHTDDEARNGALVDKAVTAETAEKGGGVGGSSWKAAGAKRKRNDH